MPLNDTYRDRSRFVNYVVGDIVYCTWIFNDATLMTISAISGSMLISDVLYDHVDNDILFLEPGSKLRFRRHTMIDMYNDDSIVVIAYMLD